MELSLRSNIPMPANGSSSSSKKVSAPPTTSLLAMLRVSEPVEPLPSSHSPPSIDSPVCVSVHHHHDTSDEIGAKSPMEDAGGYYDQATWRMYQRIQAARQETYLPLDSNNQGRPLSLQPRRTSISISNSNNDDWAFHFEQQEVTERGEEEEDEDIIFDLEL